jgi:dTDP-4-amino-4,6-dideoxygalactose transaminase
MPARGSDEPGRIPVACPSLPPLEEYVDLLRDIWDRKWLTNMGHYHGLLEQALAEYLGVPYVSLFCNGTIALQVGLRALGIAGEVITTPYSFVATTHAIQWNQCTPVFCDIDPVTCNLAPEKVEALITDRTSAILPVHVYGTPCDIHGLQRIADSYGLKVLYDAAHAFGVTVHGESILLHGDISMLSFHATKVFNTAEGGALVTRDPELKTKIDHLRNFGIADEVSVIGDGTNGKMNELQAALGLVQLRHVGKEIALRKCFSDLYRHRLSNIRGIRILPEQSGVIPNHSYFPIFVDSVRYGMTRDEVYDMLQRAGICGRRYFYPLISEFPTYVNSPGGGRHDLGVARLASEQVLCLPLHTAISESVIDKTCELLEAMCTASAFRGS